MKTTPSYIVFIALVLLSSALFSNAFAQSGEVLAIVNDKVITSIELDQLLAAGEAQMAARYPNAAERNEAMKQLRKELLDRMINDELVYMDFVTLKGKIPPKYVQDRIDRIVFEQANGNEDLFRDILHRENVTWKEFKERVLHQLAVEMLTYDRTRRNLFIPEQQICSYFEAHKAELVEPPSWHVQVIMLKKDGKYAAQLNDIVAQIRAEFAAGESFTALAKEYSEGMNAENGGDLGWQNAMAPKLQAVVEKLKPGQLYDGILDMGSLYLVYLAEKEGGSADELTPAISEKVTKILEDQEAARRYNEYIQKLYLKYPVKRFD